MRDADAAMEEILKGIDAHGCVLMLDFDGTLAPIVAHHRTAALSARTRALLKRCAQRFPTTIISGRGLTDVRKRVRLPSISYAGSHGLETHIAGAKRVRLAMPADAARIFQNAKRALQRVARKYAGTSIEKKRYSYAVHYRHVPKKMQAAFVLDARAAVAPHVATRKVRAIDDLYTFDVMPNISRTKGHCAVEMYRALRTDRLAVPIYVGDGTTDEDAFRMLKNGITIRVGLKPMSVARYYFKTRSRVDTFLARIARLPAAASATAKSAARKAASSASAPRRHRGHRA